MAATGLFVEGPGRGAGGKRGAESIHIGVGDAPRQAGGCNEKAEVVGGVGGSETGVMAMTG